MKHPRTRVLRDIWRLTEELQIVNNVAREQWALTLDYRKILEPCTYRVTTVRRTTRFKTESRFLTSQAGMETETGHKLVALLRRLEDISNHIAKMLEIQQENNGNAIIVFTLVTIIFLPLSWATSYLGMNTADMRSLNQGQWLFWIVALPLTAVVMGLALVMVFKGEEIREYFLRRRNFRPRDQDVKLRPVRRQSTLMSLTADREEPKWRTLLRRRHDGMKEKQEV